MKCSNPLPWKKEQSELLPLGREYAMVTAITVGLQCHFKYSTK